MKPNFKQIRTDNYQNNSTFMIKSKFSIDPNDWKRNPYTFLKSRFYIEASNVIIYLFLRLGVSANFTTLLYILLGFIGCLIIAWGSTPILYFGIFLVFTKSVFDWADGPIARWTKQESLKGHILDLYGANFNTICFISSLGLYSYQSTDNTFFLYVVIGYCFVCSNIITMYASDQILRSILKQQVTCKLPKNSENLKIAHVLSHLPKSKFFKLVRKLTFFRSVLDDRARSVDLLLLIIILEQNILRFAVIPYAFLFMSIRQLAYFLVDWSIYYKGSWINDFQAKKDV